MQKETTGLRPSLFLPPKLVSRRLAPLSSLNPGLRLRLRLFTGKAMDCQDLLFRAPAATRTIVVATARSQTNKCPHRQAVHPMITYLITNSTASTPTAG